MKETDSPHISLTHYEEEVRREEATLLTMMADEFIRQTVRQRAECRRQAAWLRSLEKLRTHG